MKTSTALNLLSRAQVQTFLAGAALLIGVNVSAQSTNLISNTTFDTDLALPGATAIFTAILPASAHSRIIGPITCPRTLI